MAYVGGLQVASGWLMQTPLGLFVLVSRWLARSQWVADVVSIGVICYALASGWLMSILLAWFGIASRWLAQIRWHCVLASGWLVQFHLVSLVLLVLPVGGLGVASGWYTQFLLLFLFFPFLTAWFRQRLAWIEPHPRFVCFLVGTNRDLEESAFFSVTLPWTHFKATCSSLNALLARVTTFSPNPRSKWNSYDLMIARKHLQRTVKHFGKR